MPTTSNRNKKQSLRSKLKDLEKKQKTEAEFLKLRLEIIIAFFSIVGMIAGGVLATYHFVKNEFFDESSRAVTIDYSDCVPYWEDCWGNILDTAEFDSGKITVWEGFAIRCSINNSTKSKKRVDSVRTEILSLELIEEDVIEIFITLNDAPNNTQVLRVYMLNNGWGDSKEHNIRVCFSKAIFNDWSIEYIEDTYYPITDISKESYLAESCAPMSGEIRKVAEYTLSAERFQAANLDEITPFCFLDNKPVLKGERFLSYSQEFDKFGMDSIGGYAIPYEVSLFAVLDVEKHPAALLYTAPEASSQIEEESSLFLDTVIAPTKSCHIQCRNVITINGKAKKTPIVNVTVTVPLYDEYCSISELIDEIEATKKSVNPFLRRQIAQKYRYNPKGLDNRDFYDHDLYG